MSFESTRNFKFSPNRNNDMGWIGRAQPIESYPVGIKLL